MTLMVCAGELSLQKEKDNIKRRNVELQVEQRVIMKEVVLLGLVNTGIAEGLCNDGW
jgi:hypothetical protein